MAANLILACYLAMLAWLLVRPTGAVTNRHIVFFWIPIALLLSVAASLREIGGDTAQYYDWYNEVSWDNILIGRFEPLYSIFLLFCKNFGLTFSQTLFVNALLPLALIMYFASKFDRRIFGWAVFLFVAIFWSRWGVSTLRIGIAAPLGLLAFIPGTRPIKKCTLIAIGSLFHYSVLLYFIPALISRFRFTFIILPTIIILGITILITQTNIIMLVTGLGIMAQDQQIMYFEELTGDQQITFGVGLAVLLLFLLVMKRNILGYFVGNELYRAILLSLGMICFIMLAFNAYPVFAHRASQVYRLFYVLALPSLILSMRWKESKWMVVLFVIGLSGFYIHSRV